MVTSGQMTDPASREALAKDSCGRPQFGGPILHSPSWVSPGISVLVPEGPLSPTCFPSLLLWVEVAAQTQSLRAQTQRAAPIQHLPHTPQ